MSADAQALVMMPTSPVSVDNANRRYLTIAILCLPRPGGSTETDFRPGRRAR
jgi:hypothetical protein